MAILEPADRLSADVEHVGAVIQRTPHGLHCGFVYQKADEGPRVLHLAFHHMLIDEIDHGAFRWVQLGLDADNKLVLASQLSRVALAGSLIPYGINSDGVAFDADTGDLLPAPIGRGLTCATFMSAILKSFAHQVVDWHQWPDRPEDVQWQQEIVRLLQDRAAREHVDAVAGDVGARRLRPDEIVGACSSSRWPVAFQDARTIADQILQDLGP